MSHASQVSAMSDFTVDMVIVMLVGKHSFKVLTTMRSMSNHAKNKKLYISI